MCMIVYVNAECKPDLRSDTFQGCKRKYNFGRMTTFWERPLTGSIEDSIFYISIHRGRCKCKNVDIKWKIQFLCKIYCIFKNGYLKQIFFKFFINFHVN